jgi:hypothetical protein
MSPRFIFDRVGFPMIRIEALDGYLHWFPVTKIQYETFLASDQGMCFDESGYAELLATNPRTTTKKLTPEDYWTAFVTGLRPSEVVPYAKWSQSMDPGVIDTLPSQKDWIAAYGELKQSAAIEVADLAEMSPSTRAREVLIRVGRVTGSERSVADQMLLRGGVMDWVKSGSRQGTWAAFGQPDPRFYATLFDPDSGRPSYPIDPEGVRLGSHGFRLIRRRPEDNASRLGR